MTPREALLSQDFDAHEARQLLAESERLRARLAPDSRVLYGAWGLAWLLGYGVLWLTARGGDSPPAWAFVVFATALTLAGVFTAVHITRRSGGLRGESATAGSMYGITWSIAFVATGMILAALARAGLTSEQMAVASNGIAVLVVGIMYMAGGAMYHDRSWFALGAWITVAVAAGTLIGIPHLFAVMSVGGGGVMLAVALTQHVRVRRVAR